MNAIAKFREKQGLTQEQVAELLGTSKATVSRWESSARRPDPLMAIEIETKLGIPRSELRPDLYADSAKALTASKPNKKSLYGFMKGTVTLPPDFDRTRPFYELHNDWD